MLTLQEFSVGTLADAEGLTWLKPFVESDEEFLVFAIGDRKMAIFLDPQHDFEAWECSTATNHRGILIPEVQIEIDEKSTFDTERTYAPYGALVRKGDTLSIAILASDDRRIRRQQLLPVITGLPASGSDIEVGFLKWQLSIGEGDNRRVLRTIEVKPAAGPPR